MHPRIKNTEIIPKIRRALENTPSEEFLGYSIGDRALFTEEGVAKQINKSIENGMRRFLVFVIEIDNTGEFDLIPSKFPIEIKEEENENNHSV